MAGGRTPFQDRMLKEGKCVMCGKKAAVKVLNLCETHRKQRQKRSLKRYYTKKITDQQGAPDVQVG